jgi:hypothetical protein
LSTSYFRDFELFKEYLYLNAGNFSNLISHYHLPENIPQFQGKKSIVIDASSDPCSLDWVKTLIESHNKSGVISAVLINDKKFADQHQQENFRFFPVWAYRYANQSQQYQSRDFFSPQRNYKVSCLNRMPKLERAYTYYLLNQKTWRDEIFLSFAGLTIDNNNNQGQLTVKEIEKNLGATVAEFFINELAKFPLSSEKEYQWTNCHRADSPAYTTCYSNLCTETGVSMFCPTEKTFKCIVSGTLIFPMANCGFLSALNDLGLDINYQGLNLDTIDSIQDWKSRARALVDLLDLRYQHIEDIWHNNRDQLQHNQQILMSKKIDDIILPNVQDHIC